MSNMVNCLSKLQLSKWSNFNLSYTALDLNNNTNHLLFGNNPTLQQVVAALDSGKRTQLLCSDIIYKVTLSKSCLQQKRNAAELQLFRCLTWSTIVRHRVSYIDNGHPDTYFADPSLQKSCAQQKLIINYLYIFQHLIMLALFRDLCKQSDALFG